jgi:Xaa-Pro aminopeptidase
MVITVEPGIYLPAENLGVRIEDDVRITENAGVVLTADVPREAAEIEALMAGRFQPDVISPPARRKVKR